MKTEDVLFGRRIRQNHALEHATITILSGYVPNLRISARSSSRGFIIFGDVDLGQLRRALALLAERLLGLPQSLLALLNEHREVLTFVREHE